MPSQRWPTAAVILILQLLAGTSVHAQDDAYYRNLDMIPIGVAIAETLPLPGDAVILRKLEGPAHDVIFMQTGSATAGGIASALVALSDVHFEGGVCPSARDEVSITYDERRPHRWSEADSVRTEAILERLRLMQPTELDGFGEVRVRQVWVRWVHGPKDPPAGSRVTVC